MLTNIPRVSLQSLGILRPSIVISRAVPRCPRALHQRTTSTVRAASSTQVRPRIDLSKLKPKFQSNVLAGTIRTIFIQTEKTPNADVSKRPNDQYQLLNQRRHLNFFPITLSYLRAYRRHSSNICRPDLRWRLHTLRL